VAEPDRRNVERGSMTVVITDANGNPLYGGKIYGLPIHDYVIIQKSIEFFNDPEPCYIHKGAVYMRIWTEIEQFLAQTDGGPIPLGCFPENLQSYIELVEYQEVCP